MMRTSQQGARDRDRLSKRRRARWRCWRARLLRSLRTGALGLFLLGMIAAFAFVLARPDDGASTSSGASANGRTGNTGNDWVSVRSTAPVDLLAAVRGTTLYQEVASAPQTRMGQALRTGMLGTPVLVHAYRPTPGMPDVWVVPVLASTSGSAGGTSVRSLPAASASAGPQIVALLDFAYDPKHARIRALSFAGPFVPTDPEFGQPFPRLTQATALVRMQQSRRLSLASGQQPQLVYFPVNLDALNDPHSKLKWTGGGQFPDLAVWQMPAADGHDYLVGVDGLVYTAAQLPLVPNAGR